MSKVVWRLADYLIPAAGIYGVCAIFELTGLPGETGLAIVICSLLYVTLRWLLPVLVGRGRPVGQMPRPAAQPVAEDECAGWIGWVRFQYPNLHVAVYEDRLVIETILAEHTIMHHEIDSIDDSEYFRISIRHLDRLTKSPIRLLLVRHHVVRDAIVALVEG
jgi:hypothetical protein